MDNYNDNIINKTTLDDLTPDTLEEDDRLADYTDSLNSELEIITNNQRGI